MHVTPPLTSGILHMSMLHFESDIINPHLSQWGVSHQQPAQNHGYRSLSQSWLGSLQSLHTGWQHRLHLAGVTHHWEPASRWSLFLGQFSPHTEHSSLPPFTTSGEGPGPHGPHGNH